MGSQSGYIRNWMPINLNTHAIDQNETAYQLRRIAQGHRRRDPATYRGPYDQDIMQAEPFQQLKIGKGEIINAIKPLRTWLACKARVGRHQDVRPGQPCSNA